MMKSTILFFSIALFLGGTINAQNNPDTSSHLLTPKQMREDIEFFYKKLLETHPNPYQKLTPEQLKQNIQEIQESITQPLTPKEFWFVIAKLNYAFDVHTNIETNSEMRKTSFPDDLFKFNNGVLEFNQDISYDRNILKGRIISIGQNPIEKILDSISLYVSCESKLSQEMLIEWLFPILYTNLFGDNLNTFLIKYLEDSVSKTIEIRKDKIEKMRAISSSENTRKESINLQLFQDERIALLELNRFNKVFMAGMDTVGKSLEEAYRIKLGEIIDSLSKAGIEHLFIDISANGGGGSNYALSILDYLAGLKNGEFLAATSTIKKSNCSKKKFLNISNKEAFKLFFTDRFYRKFVTKKTGKIITWDFYYSKKSNANQYKGKVYLIQGYNTFSAAMLLSSFVKYYNIGSVIGDETAGLTSCYINCCNYTLPHSKIDFRSSVQYTANIGSNNDDRGVLPDIEYKIENPRKSFTLEQLKEMLQLIKEKKQKGIN